MKKKKAILSAQLRHGKVCDSVIVGELLPSNSSDLNSPPASLSSDGSSRLLGLFGDGLQESVSLFPSMDARAQVEEEEEVVLATRSFCLGPPHSPSPSSRCGALREFGSGILTPVWFVMCVCGGLGSAATGKTTIRG